MKVALLFRSNSFGGSVRIARFIYDILIKNGREVLAMSCRDGADNGYFNDVEYKKLNIKRYSKDWFYTQRFDFFKNIFAEFDAVVTTLNPNYPFIPIIAKKMGKKVLISEHGNHLGIISLKKKIFRFLSYKSADLITFVNLFDFEYFSNFKNTMLVRNPMLLNLNVDLNHKENIVLFPSRLDKNKRFDFLLSAFAKIDYEIRKNYKMVVCGDGEFKDKYENFAKQNKINLEILGFVKDIQNYYAKSKIVALTSKSEGFANILMEAIFFNCARISVDCKAGPSELIKDNYDGFLSSQNDINEFAKKLEILLKDSKTMEKFIKNANLRKDEFMPEMIEKKWLEAFNRGGI